jgi:hypothetical protein
LLRIYRLDGCTFIEINGYPRCKHDLIGKWEHMSAQLRKTEKE